MLCSALARRAQLCGAFPESFPILLGPSLAEAGIIDSLPVRRFKERPLNSRVVSCGVVLLDSEGRVLLAHATETRHWDIPKGHSEPGEARAETALRELREETGIELDAGRLHDLGLFVYRRDKDLHLFAARVRDDEFDLARCTCTSMFPRRTDGKMIPEMDAYRWVAPLEVERYASRSLAKLFFTTLSLTKLHETL